MEQNNFSREQLEEMIPDYAFNRLASAEREEFEREIQKFPELINEVNEIRSVFSKVEQMDFNNILDQRTRNLSVKVNARLHKESPTPQRSGWLRRLAPALAVMVLIVGVMNKDFFLKSDDAPSFDDELTTMLNKDASAELFHQQYSDANAEIPQEMIPHDLNGETLNSNDATVSEQMDKLLAESVIRASTSETDVNGDDGDNDALDLMNSVDIQEAEQILREIEDVTG